jgi:hypothetical protein
MGRDKVTRYSLPIGVLPQSFDHRVFDVAQSAAQTIFQLVGVTSSHD